MQGTNKRRKKAKQTKPRESDCEDGKDGRGSETAWGGCETTPSQVGTQTAEAGIEAEPTDQPNPIMGEFDSKAALPRTDRETIYPVEPNTTSDKQSGSPSPQDAHSTIQNVTSTHASTHQQDPAVYH
jgi:hypothetical protein